MRRDAFRRRLAGDAFGGGKGGGCVDRFTSVARRDAVAGFRPKPRSSRRRFGGRRDAAGRLPRRLVVEVVAGYRAGQLAH